ncbi:STAS domain-containing protein [Bacillus taeanensis]|uniref:RsbT co-antagonist protein RsbRA n=1 Tax=Bacillus taeanensis TaxID=273032 RepID=A0A366XPM4_9BACI|nr:STAS domain-containing protein [Bacillus taeanensis]RBW67847.1 RsbT co-antagonist protein RsbRA [Bacillus taeanensis]
MDRLIVEMIQSYKQEICERWRSETNLAKEQHRLQNISSVMYENTNDEFVEMMFQHIETHNNPSAEQLLSFAEHLMKIGWNLSYLTQGMQTFRRILLDVLFENDIENRRVIEIYQEIDRWFDPILNELIDHSSKNWENTVSLQKVALQELSAPLIPVLEQISVMPLVGTIDTERAKLIMENLLNGVIKHRSQVVLIDITGVPVVDTMVAHHIIQAAEAVRLIGAQCILVGIRPEIAQTIVNLGIDLGQFPTKSTLFKGMKTALELTKRNIVDIT